MHSLILIEVIITLHIFFFRNVFEGKNNEMNDVINSMAYRQQHCICKMHQIYNYTKISLMMGGAFYSTQKKTFELDATLSVFIKSISHK